MFIQVQCTAMVGALFIIYEPYEPYGAKRCTDKTLLGP